MTKTIILSDLGSTFAVRVTPRAAQTDVRVVPDEKGTLLVHVRVPCVPEDGKANRAVIAALAKALGIAKSRLTITHGAASRDKVVRVD